MTYQVILCFKHGYYKGVMCPICNHFDMQYAVGKPAEEKTAELLSVPCNSAKFRNTTLLEFL